MPLLMVERAGDPGADGQLVSSVVEVKPEVVPDKYLRTFLTFEDDRHGYVVSYEVKGDVYNVIAMYDVRCPGLQHALKKILRPGQRGQKSVRQDLEEAIVSIRRAIDLLGD